MVAFVIICYLISQIKGTERKHEKDASLTLVVCGVNIDGKRAVNILKRVGTSIFTIQYMYLLRASIAMSSVHLQPMICSAA